MIEIKLINIKIKFILILEKIILGLNININKIVVGLIRQDIRKYL
tara:strand:+ start:908 stop:1042 length:135 start_codon:yes stop_codon:yes gene_type:complete